MLALAAAVSWALLAAESGDQANQGPVINDHWHAAYAISICALRQPPIATFPAPEGVHTHGDGIIHIHPHTQTGEGAGAALARFFAYGGGELTRSSLRLPASADTHVSGRVTCDSEPAALRILRADSGIHPLSGGEASPFRNAVTVCDALPESEFDAVGPDYIPQDGDCIRIVFEPE